MRLREMPKRMDANGKLSDERMMTVSSDATS